MQLEFTKMHGLGNDFIVFDAPRDWPIDGERLRALACRKTGIGFDQALILEAPRQADTVVYYRIFNADGTEVEQCGNGARCVARLMADRLRLGRSEFKMGSPAGLVMARTEGSGLVSVAMGTPSFMPSALPFDAPIDTPFHRLALAQQNIEISVVAIGNPHAVLKVPSVEHALVDSIGPEVENHPRFARRTNVEFMEVVSTTHIRLRVYERGVGETTACGTGACAAVAVGRRHGWLATEVDVDLPGGRLHVTWPGDQHAIWLTGPTATVFKGQMDL
jgi:diaminopimelate epimerase